MSGRDHSCEACGRGGMNDPRDAEISRLKAEVERLMKELDATQEALARYRRAGIEAEGEIQTLRRELEETQIVAEGHRDSNKILFRDNKEFLRLRDSAVSIAERAEHRANQCEAERDQARADLETERRRASQLSVENECLKADLAAAQKREDARKAWREKYAERCETRGGDVQGCGTWIHYRDVLDAIGRGEGPK
jgi:DNA repair exonuclease SbcCD ATPase subunit